MIKKIICEKIELFLGSNNLINVRVVLSKKIYDQFYDPLSQGTVTVDIVRTDIEETPQIIEEGGK